MIRQLACSQGYSSWRPSELTVRIILSVRSGMLETNKQTFLFSFGDDLSYFVILRYKLRDFIKIYDDFVNDLIKGNFS